MTYLVLSVGSLLLVFIYLFVISLRLRRLPPGPPSLPVLGVASFHPRSEYWKTYGDWGRRYGHKGLLSFHVLGRRMVVVNTASVAEDLFNKRSNIYNDRPFPTMAGLLMKREKSMFYISYNERCKAYRKLMHQALSATASQEYWGVQERASCVMIKNILHDPDRLLRHLRREAAYVTMQVSYGYTIGGEDDHFVLIAEEAMRVASLAGAPGKWLVDSFPFLRFLPEWLPGAGFKRQARTWGDHLYSQSLKPHNWVKEQIIRGTAAPSFSSNLLTDSTGNLNKDEENDDVVLWTAGALYAAGADTSVSTVHTFIFLMVCHPEVQKRAQADVDEFITEEQRLPTLQDRARGALPYLTCIIQEVLRWHPPSPFGLFHATATDDVYEGYEIPAKTTIIGNVWAIMHDPDVYPEPDVFNPSRFERPSPQQDPRDFVFGFGRRVCPGQHIAENSVWIQVALILACLRLEKALDKNGHVVEPETAFTTAIVSYVKPFPCKINCRSNKAMELLAHTMSSESLKSA